MTKTNTAVAGARAATIAAPRARTDHLSGTQKAAIILRVLLAEGVDLPLSSLPEHEQTALTRALASLRLIDRPTMWAVVEEFVEMLEQVGMSFPESMEEALALLDGKLDARVSTKLRAIARGGPGDDPWTAIELADLPALTAVLQRESTVVGAVVLSKLSTEKAAALLTALPGDLAQTLALAVARTDSISPDAVSRIGLSLADQLRDKPPRAFASPSAQRIGDILNSSSSALRDRLLSGLEQSDQTFASGVRRSIFTFQDIPNRVGARDVAAILRNLADEDLHLILAADDPGSRATMDFMLENTSKRLAEGLREDAATLPRPSAEDLDAAQSRVSAAIRAMADAGDLQLVSAAGAT
ncbi:FliG C-terminal domain-containing protein [Roseinatronobacter sp.]|uniref:FliG C-terminal domain-containing protein n=1 Tax=Roseinatronobacter sp. TaxID=1945755 RepID=UPI0025D194B4|nr:FliG C-terminal domain-containing protein [Roseibaca sp.]